MESDEGTGEKQSLLRFTKGVSAANTPIPQYITGKIPDPQMRRNILVIINDAGFSMNYEYSSHRRVETKVKEGAI